MSNPAKFRDGIKTKFVQHDNLTTAQKLAIPQVKGTVAFDTDLNELQVYNGTEWITFGSEIKTSDDITEGNTNLFLDSDQDEKLRFLHVNSSSDRTVLGNGANNNPNAGASTFIGHTAGKDATGSNITAVGKDAASNVATNGTYIGIGSGAGSNAGNAVFLGQDAGQRAIGLNNTAVGYKAGEFPIGNTLNVISSTAIGAFAIIDKSFQVALGNQNVTELKIGETLVVDKAQIVAQPEGVLVTKKVGGKTVVEVAKEYQELVGVKEPINGYYNRFNSGIYVNGSFFSSLHEITPNTNYYASSVVNGSAIALAVYFDENNNFLGFQNAGTNGVREVYERELLTIPDNTKFVGLSSRDDFGVLEYKSFKIEASVLPFLSNNKQDKKILWLGTSIPASGYPQMVGEKIKATVYNEALGSSMARAFHGVTKSFKDLNYISCLRSLSQTIAEKQSIMDNWQSNLDSNGLTSTEGGAAPFTFGWRDLLTGNPPADYTTFASAATILSWSYENKIVAKYLDETNPQFIGTPDFFVFDHGHNDVANPNYDSSEADAINVPVDNDDRSNFLGATNFLVDVILSYNPRARIMFIGHYENDRKERIWKAQENIANHLDFPFLRLWEKLGFSQRTITTTGFWQSPTVWVNSGGTAQNLTMTQVYMQDNLHPFSESTKELIANSIAPFINNNF